MHRNTPWGREAQPEYCTWQSAHFWLPLDRISLFRLSLLLGGAAAERLQSALRLQGGLQSGCVNRHDSEWDDGRSGRRGERLWRGAIAKKVRPENVLGGVRALGQPGRTVRAGVRDRRFVILARYRYEVTRSLHQNR
eukprot:scaffold193_cov255-Pinguiococcus_pyrenoidosus.AAC.42